MTKGMGALSGQEVKMMRKSIPSLRGRAAKKYGPMSGMQMLNSINKSKIKKFL